MSYILEALKKSQQERDLGHVPRIQSVAFDERLEPSQSHRWIYLALFLALIAVAVALYAVLRRDAPAPGERIAAAAQSMPAQAPPIQQSNVGRSQIEEAEPRPPVLDRASAASSELVSPRVSEAAPDRLSGPSPPAVVSPAAVRPIVSQPPTPRLAMPSPSIVPARAQEPNPTDDDSDLGGEPQVLVVPAPPKPGKPMPRGAEELRRAVLGDEVSSMAAPQPVPSLPALDETTPVPQDLIADIEAFKQQVRTVPPPPPPPVAAAPRPPDLIGGVPEASGFGEAEIPPRASMALRQQLPVFSMPVHVYDVDPSRRFVYINGRKLSERQRSREGLRVEQVLADGAVLSWQGERFFQPR